LHDASNIAAVIVEPFSGSAGVIIPPVGYLQRLRDICTANNILLIFDEVITGFGRCRRVHRRRGLWCDARHHECIAKQITNGTQPLGAVVATKEIYDTFMNSRRPGLHAGVSSMATPTPPIRWRVRPVLPRSTCWSRTT
jgi:beta-alanine--pyruvate transaminase